MLILTSHLTLFRITKQEFFEFFREPKVIVFLLLALPMIWYLYPSEGLRDFRPIFQLVSVLTGGVFFYCFYIATFLLFDWLNRHFRVVFFTTLATLVATVGTELIYVAVYDVWLQKRSMEIGVFEHILRVFFMLYFFEVILVGFILPTTVSGAKGLERTLFSLVGGAAENAAETKSDAERTLDIKAANLRDDPRATGALTRETDDQQAATVMVRVLESDKPVGDIIMLQADDHYVWIIGTQSKEHLRGTLAAATKHLDAHGMLISRSTWVAWSAIEHLDETAKGRVAVHLKSGDVVPVSRARTLDFMSRYARVKAV